MSHDHGSTTGQQGKNLIIVLLLTSTVFVAEVIGGLVANSLALLADAGHMLTDIVGVGLALFAVWMGNRPPTPERTFGFYRFEIFAAVINAVLLFGIGIYVLVEAIERFSNPSEVGSGLMLAIGAVGLVVNCISLWILRKGQAESLNVRGAFLEVLSDMLGSIAVIVGAIVISITGFEQTDAIISVVIAVMIFPRTWHLLRDAVNVLLEATPKNVDLEEVRKHVMETPGVVDVHDLHVWTITSGMPVISAHVVVEHGIANGKVLDGLGKCLAGHFDIEHSTFQLEPRGHVGHESHLHS
jgi:cobalt-zinc-cadmium efflux system protein